MSPVSRGRKGKKPKKKAGRARTTRHTLANAWNAELRPALAALGSPLAPPLRPKWFDPSIRTVLDQGDAVMAARGPRELEQATAELLGAELHRVVREGFDETLFDWWIEALAEEAAVRVQQESASSDSAWQTSWRLLHGLTSIGSPGLRSIAQTALARSKPDMASHPQPEWLPQLAHIAATGEMWQLRDAYGTRLALIAGFSYPGATDPSVFLFDVDVSGLVELVNPGVFDDMRQAADAWRTQVGDTADGVQPRPVETTEDLLPLVHLELDDRALSGSESRDAMNNWFRVNRRIFDVADALESKGMSLPRARSLYDVDVDPLAEAFSKWHELRHGTRPDHEAVGALAEEWMEGTLPATWYTVSPRRMEFQCRLIGDWFTEDPVTIAVKELLPEWARWLGERAELPEHLVDRVVATAS